MIKTQFAFLIIIVALHFTDFAYGTAVPTGTLPGPSPSGTPTATPTPPVTPTPVPTPAAPQFCVTPEDRKDFFSDFKVTRWDPKKHIWSSKIDFDPCDENSIPQQLVRAYRQFIDLEGVTWKQDEYDQGIMGTSPITYLRDRVREFRIRNDKTDVCKVAAAYVQNSQPIVYICPSFANEFVLEHGVTLLHEARHTEGYQHVHCIRGPWAKSDVETANFSPGSCDESYEMRGSYAVSAEFSVRLSRNDKLSAEDRMIGRSLAVAFFTDHFNRLPLQLREGVLLKNQQGPFEFYDGREAILLDKLDPGLILTSSTEYPILLDPKKNELSFLDQMIAVTVQVGMDPVFNSFDGVLDRVKSGELVCYILKDSLICRTDAKTSFQIRLHDFSGVQFVPFKSNFALLGSDGAMYELPKTKNQLFSLKETGTLKQVAPQANILSQVIMRDHWKLVVLSDGQLRYVNTANGVASQARGLAPEKRFQRIWGPIIWSKKLEDL